MFNDVKVAHATPAYKTTSTMIMSMVMDYENLSVESTISKWNNAMNWVATNKLDCWSYVACRAINLAHQQLEMLNLSYRLSFTEIYGPPCLLSLTHSNM